MKSNRETKHHHHHQQQQQQQQQQPKQTEICETEIAM